MKIEPLSNHFVKEFKKLDKQGKVGKLKDISVKLGFKGSSGLSEILAGRSNIQPVQWEKFRKEFNLSEFSDSHGNGVKSEDRQVLRYEGSISIEDYIKEKEARRKESEERAIRAEAEKEKLFQLLEANLNKAMVGVDTLVLEVYSARQVVLQSLARLEGKGTEDDLLTEANNIMLSMRETADKKGKLR